MRKDQINTGIGIFIIIIMFLTTSSFVQNNLEYIKSLIDFGLVSMIIYVLILIISVVIAPVNAVPLLPIASNVFGWIVTAILSIIGWTIGALIAFGLARKYGIPLIKKFVSLEQIAKYEKLIPEENIFWGVVFLRMAVPVDILSYVLGLFSHIKFRTYAIATLIGVSPFAFIFAYVGTLELRFQIIAFLIAMMILLIGYLAKLLRKKYKKKN